MDDDPGVYVTQPGSSTNKEGLTKGSGARKRTGWELGKRVREEASHLRRVELGRQCANHTGHEASRSGPPVRPAARCEGLPAYSCHHFIHPEKSQDSPRPVPATASYISKHGLPILCNTLKDDSCWMWDMRRAALLCESCGCWTTSHPGGQPATHWPTQLGCSPRASGSPARVGGDLVSGIFKKLKKKKLNT